MGFFTYKQNKPGQPVYNQIKYQRQGAQAVKKVLDRSGLTLAKRQTIRKALAEKFKGGKTVFNNEVVEVVHDLYGTGKKHIVEKAFLPPVDEKAIRERIKKNLKYALSQRVREEMDIKGKVDKVSILGSTRAQIRGKRKIEVRKSNLGVNPEGGSASIVDSKKTGGFAKPLK